MKKKLTVVIIAICLLVSLSVGLFANAAEAPSAYKGDLEGNAVMAGARTEKQIADALTAKVDAINATIKTVTDKVDVTDMDENATNAAFQAALQTAFGKGEVLAYSRRGNGQINADNRRSGYKEWDGLFVVDFKFLNAGYDGWGDHSVAWMSYDGVEDTAYMVAGKFAKKWESTKKVGQPIGDKFRVAGEGTNYVEYQNFQGGYFKSENGNDCTEVYAKNYVKDGDTWKEVRADGQANGNVGAVEKDSNVTDSYHTPIRIYNAFNKVYDEFKSDGFIVGSPWTAVKMNAGDYRFPAQEFFYGDSVAAPWGGDRQGWTLIGYNTEMAEAFVLRDEFAYIKDRRGDVNNEDMQALGMPTSNDFEFDGNRYQNFANGYIKVTGATPANTNEGITIIKGLNMNEDGTTVSVDPAERIGVLSPTLELPEGITKEALTKLFTDCYATIDVDEEFKGLLPTRLVGMANGIVCQTYQTESKANAMLAYDSAAKAVYFVSPAVYQAYSLNPVGYGYPTTGTLTVAAGDASKNLEPVKVQGFRFGYIKILSTIQYDEDWELYQEDKGFGTIGATYVDEFKHFASINYADSVGKLNTTTSGSNDIAPSLTKDKLGVDVPSNEVLSAAFKQAYIDIFNMGYNCGEPSEGGILLWMSGNSGIIKLTFKGGNGTANFWGDNAMLAYDLTNNKVRLVTDKVLDGYAQGASGNGWPVTDMMINPQTGEIVQNFLCVDKVMTEGRKTMIKVVNGQSNRVENEHFDFESEEGKKYVPFLSQYASGDVTLKTFTPATSYELDKAVSIDVKALVNNDSKYDIVFDTAVSKGTLSAAGVWTYTPTANEVVELKVNIYTAFSKITFSTTLTMGEGNVEPEPEPTPEPPAKKGCFGTVGSASVTMLGISSVCLLGLFFCLKRKQKKA